MVDSLTDTYVLRGTSLILGCWRSGRTHPYHFMFGLANFIVSFVRRRQLSRLITSYFSVSRRLRHRVFSRELENDIPCWFKLNFIDSNTRLYRTNSNDDDDRKHSLCTENALFHPSVGTLLGYPSEEKFFEMWRSDF